MKQVAEEKNVKLIDLMTKSLNYYNSIGYNETYKLFMVSVNNTDYTHFTEKGASRLPGWWHKALKRQIWILRSI